MFMRILTLALLALSTAAVAHAADVPVSVYVNGQLQSYDPPALMRDGTVYVPLRAGAQSLGIDVKWDAGRKVAQICTDTGCTFIMQNEGITQNGRLLLPLRKMGEATGSRVMWDAQQKAVRITR